MDLVCTSLNPAKFSGTIRYIYVYEAVQYTTYDNVVNGEYKTYIANGPGIDLKGYGISKEPTLISSTISFGPTFAHLESYSYLYYIGVNSTEKGPTSNGGDDVPDSP